MPEKEGEGVREREREGMGYHQRGERWVTGTGEERVGHRCKEERGGGVGRKKGRG